MTSSQSLARLTASSISLLTGFAFCSRPKKKSARGRFSQDYELAEEEGFEPRIRFWRIHDFQSCSFGQLGHLSASPSCAPSSDEAAAK